MIEGNWTWTDCSPWNFTNWRGGGQPDNARNKDGDGENCAVLQTNKSRFGYGWNGWNDVPCHWRELHYVCQKPICSGDICENFPFLIHLIFRRNLFFNCDLGYYLQLCFWRFALCCPCIACNKALEEKS